MSDSKAARLAEILEGYLTDVRAGRTPDAQALVARNPDIAEDLRSGLASLEFFRQAQADVEPGAGRVLGDYRILREVGRGGMGVVYEAEQLSLKRRVALKVLPFAAILDPKQLQRFHNEAQAAAHLHHTNIVPVYGVGCERGVHYYAMQYIEGESLAVAIGDMKRGGAGDGPRSPISSHGSNREPAYLRMAARLGVQAAEALDHAHQLGVVHRDIKPGNLLVDAAGTLWITDFGLARSRADAGLTMTGEMLGTLRYMSPEQALAKRVPVDHRTDIYSLGATLYELFTLEHALPGDDAPAVIHDLAFKDPLRARRLNPALPVDLETILLKAMAKDAASRYETAQEMADDMRRFLAHEPIRASPPTLLDRARKWARRHQALVATGCVALLLMLVGSVAGLLLIAREKARADRNYESSELRLVDAEHSLGLVREAVDEMLTKVGSRELADIPKFEPLRRDLLMKAAEIYGTLLKRHGDDPALRFDAGQAWKRLGSIRKWLGEHARAAEAYEKAVQLLDDLAREHPRVEEYRRVLSDALVEWGGLCAHRGKPVDAEVHCRRAVEVWNGVRPASREARKCLADAHLALGEVRSEGDSEVREALGIYEELLREAGEDTELLVGKLNALSRLSAALMEKGLHEEAAARSRETVELADRAVAASPRDAPWPRDICAEEHHDLGVVLVRLGQGAEAESEFRRALAVFEGLARDFPSVPKYRSGLGDEHLSLANFLVGAGNLPEAERHALESVEVLDALTQEHPGVPEQVQRRVRAHWGLAYVLWAMGKFDGAEERFGVAADLCTKLVADHPSEEYRSLLAHIEAHLGRMLVQLRRLERAEAAYRAALEQFTELGKAGPLPEPLRDDRARVLRSLSDVLRDRGKFPEAEPLYRDAIATLEELLAQWPDSQSYRTDLANAQLNLGALLMRTGRADEGISCVAKAREHYTELVSRYPDVPEHREGLASCIGDLGRGLLECGRRGEAETAFHEAVDLREQIHRTQPSERNTEQLAEFLNLLADRVVKARPAEAELLFRRGIELREDLVRDAPDNSQHQVRLGGMLHNYAVALSGLGQREKAVALYERAIVHQRKALAANPTDPTARRYLENHCRSLAVASLELGDHPRGAVAGAGLAAVDPGRGILRCEAASYLSRAAQVALGDERIDPAARVRVAGAYADQAKAFIADLAASCPDDAKARDCLADEWCNVGMRLGQLGRLGESVAALEEARRHYEIVRTRPDGIAYREDMSLCLQSLGHQLVASRRHGDAEAAFMESVELRKEVVDADRSARNLALLADALDGLGSELLRDRPAEAEAAFRDGLELREERARAENSPACQVGLGGTLHNYANALADLGQNEKAAALYERAIGFQREALAADPDVRGAREFLALHYQRLSDVLLGLGDHARAATAAARLAETNGGEGEACWRLARCADLAAKDQRLKAPERAGVARTYAEQAKVILVGTAERTPGRPMPWTALGWASVRGGDWKGAVEALGKDPKGAGAFEWFLLATAHARLGHAREARRAFDRGVALADTHKGDKGIEVSADTPASDEADALRERLEVTDADVSAQRAEASRLLGLARSGG